jgi:hypothetical protein
MTSSASLNTIEFIANREPCWSIVLTLGSTKKAQLKKSLGIILMEIS